MATTRSRIAPIAICLAFGLAACGDDTSSPTTDEATTPVDDGDRSGYDLPTAVETTVDDSTETSVGYSTDISVDDSNDEGIFDPFVIELSEDRLVDAAGMSLYIFTNDPNDSTVSTCYDSCASTWPPVIIGNVEELDADSSINFDNFNFVFRDDGGIQITYFGAPLYYYVGDTAPGDTNGAGIGGVWFVATVDG